MTETSHSITDLTRKYNQNGPRYTSYPTALELAKGVDDSHLVQALQHSDHHDVSLYFHIPFCHQLCYYCACNKMVTRQQEKAERYLGYLFKEIIQRSVYLKDKRICQIHLGGGTPNFLRPEQLSLLLDTVRRRTNLKQDAEISIELDPRLIQHGDLKALRKAGFNRISMGIQDFDRAVQLAINRVQEVEDVQDIMAEARQIGFDSVNMDLVYGLPHQSLNTAEYTLDCIEQLQPDRLSLFNYAHMPSRFAAQRKIKDEWLPSADLKQEMLEYAKARLLKMGYQHIGMDHFAKEDDPLSIAQREGRLHRNFQGYTELDEAELVGFGITSISQVGDVICQNHKTLHDYYQAIDHIESGHNANIVDKGILLSKDDHVRAAVIKQLICHYQLIFSEIEKAFDIQFKEYFAEELEMLKPMENDRLISIDEQGIFVAEQGRAFVRTVCMCFDVYLPKYRRTAAFSKVI